MPVTAHRLPTTGRAGQLLVIDAGSVIGQDVPDGALGASPGVARSQQRNVEGYAERGPKSSKSD